MTANDTYLNMVKFLTMAFVLAFIVYAANANEIIMDLDPFPACTECMPENSDTLPLNHPPVNGLDQPLQSYNLPKISLGNNGMISVAVLNPDLTNFDSVRFAVVEVADLEISAEYQSYALKDINADEKTDIVFYFSTRDLIPPHPADKTIDHDACLIVDILKTDHTISNYNLCEHAIFLTQDNI